MSEWFYSLPLGSMAVCILLLTSSVTCIVYMLIQQLAQSTERAKAFASISGGMLPPLGVVYGLFVTIVASQVWAERDKANMAVYHEASALSTVMLMSSSFPVQTQEHIRYFLHGYVHKAITKEWPMMAHRQIVLEINSQLLSEALRFVLTLTPYNEGQRTAQNGIVNALQEAQDARRQRIVVSLTKVNWVKWAGILLQAVCTLLAIGMIHCTHRTAALNAMGIFAVGVAVSVFIIASHEKPFTGTLAIGPDMLIEVEAATLRPTAR